MKQLRAKTYLENKRLVEINCELLDNHLPHSGLQQKIPYQPPTQQLLIQSPGSTIRTEHACMGVKMIICRRIFLANLIIIDTQGLDVILGSD